MLFIITSIIIIASIFGISKLEVENSFINYFDKETEIYKGMKKIDDELGGTTPLNIIIKFPQNKLKKKMMMSFLNGMMMLKMKKDKAKVLVYKRQNGQNFKSS